jgi:hypothetical protein
MAKVQRPEPAGKSRGPGRGLRRWRLWCLGWAGLLAVSLLGGAWQPTPPPANSGVPAPPQPGVVPATAKAPAEPLDEPLRLIAQARDAYAKVNDYACVLVKRERLEGSLSPNHVIALRVRAHPFSVAMRWHEPRDLVNQEVCYVAGRNAGNMRVRPSGVLGSFGFVTLAPDDPRALKTSRHKITEAGIGNLIERYGRGWEAERALGQTQVRLGTYEFNKRRCTRVEVSHASNPAGRFLYQKSVVYFDQQTHLPIRVENYAWPTRSGAPAELLEVFSYVNLRLNVGLGEEVFNRCVAEPRPLGSGEDRAP